MELNAREQQEMMELMFDVKHENFWDSAIEKIYVHGGEQYMEFTYQTDTNGQGKNVSATLPLYHLTERFDISVELDMGVLSITNIEVK